MTDEISLEPENWDSFSQTAHAALDMAIRHLHSRRDAPVWRQPPDKLRARMHMPLPRKGQDAAVLNQQIVTDILPYDVGNTHPRFFGWVHGAGTPAGLLPDMFAAAMNANLGGRDHMAIEVEKQVIAWCCQMFSFPETAGGLVVSGTSMATLIAMKSAREKHGGMKLRTAGLAQGGPRLVAYASSEAHSCIARAFDILGLGKDALRAIPTNERFEMDSGMLKSAIARDRAAGYQPFCVIGTAGAVNVGAIDPLDILADIAAENRLWFHVDGAFGALAILDEDMKPRLKGIERADSLAFDFHKWMHVNYDAGFILMRDAETQRAAFSERPDYLEGATRGLAAGNPWPCEYGPELSRGFRALKIWYHISHFGLDRIGAAIAMNCTQARALGDMVRATPELTLLAPVALNIVCFRFDPGNLDETTLERLNGNIVIALQERALAAPSTTRLDGKLAIRVNLTNHRTRQADLEFLLDHIIALAADPALRQVKGGG